MSPMTSQITNLTIVYTSVYSSADQRKHHSSASLAFVREILTGEFIAQRASNAENVSIWWRHRGTSLQLLNRLFYRGVAYMFQPGQVINACANPLQLKHGDQKENNNDRTQLDPDWHTSKRSLQERNAVMLNNELLADVYFLVGSSSSKARRIPAHKYILVTGSSVFLRTKRSPFLMWNHRSSSPYSSELWIKE